MDISIRAYNALKGEIFSQGENALPGDKSITHRAALLSSLAEGKSIVRNFVESGVTRVMLNALFQLGIDWELEDKTLTVQGKGIQGFNSTKEAIYCGNSATTLRLLTGAVAASGIETVLDGSRGLRKRPMNRIIGPLQLMGVNLYGKNGYPPLVISKPTLPLKAINYTQSIASAQVKSCILLASLSAEGTTIIDEPGPARDHTERMLRMMGVDIQAKIISDSQNANYVYRTIINNQFPAQLKELNLTIPGDISAASFLIVATIIKPESELIIHGVGLNPTRIGLIEVLQDMGAEIMITETGEKDMEPFGDIFVRSSKLRGCTVEGPLVVRMIDEFPVFAIAAACAEGKTTVRDAVELRYKESDRIAVLCSELKRIGVSIIERADGFEIDGGHTLMGGIVDPHGDHRLAMSLAIAGLVTEKPVLVKGAEIINESFPNFTLIMKSLGANVNEKGNL
jgi:3-phosphoshikimate 1-carboxyvinyltransferase